MEFNTIYTKLMIRQFLRNCNTLTRTCLGIKLKLSEKNQFLPPFFSKSEKNMANISKTINYFEKKFLGQ